MARNSEFEGTGIEPVGPAGGTGAILDPVTLAGTGSGNTADGGTDDFDPAIHIGRDKRNKDGSYRQKRGRKAGGNKSNQKASVSLVGIEKVLFSIHAIAATATHTPELTLEDDEAKVMAEAIGNVAQHYNTEIDPVVIAWINLAACSATVYGPRVYLIRERRKQEAIMEAEKRRANDPNLYNINGSN